MVGFGLTEVLSTRGGSKTRFTLSCLGSPLPQPSLFVSDEGVPYPHPSLPPLLIIKAPTSLDVWRVGLEATQTGLFENIILRPSASCPVAHLRRLQIHAERTRTRIFLLPRIKLPHWLIKNTYETNPLL